MLSSNFYSTVLALSALLSQTYGQLFTECIRTCIDNSQYSNCQATDFKCLCRAGRTSGSFLPDVVSCMHNSCIDIGVDILLMPLQLTCSLAGTPLPDSAIDAANSEASSLAAETQMQTQTVTTTAATEFTRVVQTTITQTAQGTTQIIVFPVTIERTKTISGEGPTITRGAVASTASNSNSKFGSYSVASNSNSRSSSSSSSAFSSMVSSVRTGSASATSAPTSEESTTTMVVTSTTVLGQAVTSTISSTQSSAAATTQPGTEANSAPFTNTNAVGKVVVGGSSLSLGILVMMGVLWF